MNTICKLLFTLSILLLLSIDAVATGPSYVISNINPIAISKNGEVLCRTRFIQNPTGGHYYQTIEYGMCVLTKDTILYNKVHLLVQEDISDDKDREAQYNQWESFYSSPYNSKQKNRIEQGYNFSGKDIPTYLRNDTLSFDSFKSRYKVNLKKTPQYSLYGGKGLFGDECIDENDSISTDLNVVIEYDFGDILLIRNQLSDWTCYGASFDYENMFGGENIGFEYFNVTGVVFRKKK